MNTCKNCETPLSENAKFCNECGAKVIEGDSSLKSIFSEFLTNTFGWDNKVFLTVKTMLVRPEKLLKEYLAGTRKRYVSPFAFLTIFAGLTLLTINQFSDKFIEITTQHETSQAWLNDTFLEKEIDEMRKNGISADSLKTYRENSLAKQQRENEKVKELMQNIGLKYMNLSIYLMHPINAFLIFLIFGKPYRYSQHLIIFSYIQGIAFLFTNILFLLSLVISPIFYNMSLLVGVAWLMYVYKRLYQFNKKQVAGKVFKYFGVLLLFALILGALTVGIGMLLYKTGIIEK